MHISFSVFSNSSYPLMEEDLTLFFNRKESALAHFKYIEKETCCSHDTTYRMI